MLDYKTWYEALAEIHVYVGLEMYDSAASDLESLIYRLDGAVEEPTGFFKPSLEDTRVTTRAMVHEWVGYAGSSGTSNINNETVRRLNHAYHIAKHLAGDN